MHNWKKFKRWANKHDQILTVIGAMVIFATFMVKDVLWERQQEVETSLEFGEATFAIRDEVATEIRDLAASARHISNAIDQQKGSSTMTEPVPEVLVNEMVIDDWISKDSKLLDLERFADNERCASETKTALDKAGKKSDSDEARRLLAHLDMWGLQDCRGRLIVAVRHKRDQSDLWKNIWSYVSIVLFIVGWMMALVGKLTKNDKITPIEVI